MKNKLHIFKEDNLSLKNTINVLISIMILSGIFGFVYETIFYRIDLGYFTKRGSSFGPWIPIYAYGGLLITIFTYNLRKNPYLVLIINCIITGLIEYITGYILYEYFSLRLWDYNTEIWNLGNINGYICLRSVLFFGLSSLFLIYILIPMLIKLTKKTKEKDLTIISIVILLIYLIDVISYLIIK